MTLGKKIFFGSLFLLALVSVVHLGLRNFPCRLDQHPTVVYHGATGPQALGGAFTLNNTQGGTVTQKDLANTSKGRYSLVYFGYTFCPDICPMALSNITTAVQQLSQAQQDRLGLYFITIDPQRDTLVNLRDFLAPFGAQWQGLTGTPAQVTQATKAFGVYAAKVQDAKAQTPYYLMDHSSIVYVMNPQGTYVAHFSHATPPAEILTLLKDLLQGAGSENNKLPHRSTPVSSQKI